MSLIERAQEQISERDAKEMEAKLRKAEFTLDDFLDQLRQVRKMTAGQGLAGLLGMLPGVGRQVKNLKVDERQVDRVEAIILSMTPAERRNPRIIDGSRRRRIAAGQRLVRAAGEPAPRAVQAGAEDDAPDRARKDAAIARVERPLASALGTSQEAVLTRSLKGGTSHPRPPGAPGAPDPERVRLSSRTASARARTPRTSPSEVFARALRYSVEVRRLQGDADRLAARHRPARPRGARQRGLGDRRGGPGRRGAGRRSSTTR